MSRVLFLKPHMLYDCIMNNHNWRPIESRRGIGAPRVAIVACTHGDEFLGERVINAFKFVPLQRGCLLFITAHPLARARKKRYIDQDLNRSFPGKQQGCLEDRLAFNLRQQLSTVDLVIDIHATNSLLDSLAIVTKLTPAIRRILRWLPVKNIALIEPQVFGNKEMIGHVQVGIALEYGPEKSGQNNRRAVNHVRALLRNLSMVAGSKSLWTEKVLYRVRGQYMVPRGFREVSGLRDLRRIRQGQMIGRVGTKKIYATETFYPIFLGKGRYRGTLSLKAQRERLSIVSIKKRQATKR